MESIEAGLEASGIKRTKPRIAILNVLNESALPMTAESVYRKVQDMSINLSTVYRTLNFFVKAGLAKKEFNEKKENAYLVNDGRHQHVLICVKCHKKVFLPECPYHDANRDIEKDTGFKVYDHNIELFGLCPECQKKEKEGK